jgi:hypothetical protein
VFVGVVLIAGTPARPDEASASVLPARTLPDVTVLHSTGVATQLDDATAEQIARDLVANLGNEADAVLRRDPDRATAGAAGERLASVWARIDAAGEAVDVPEFDLEHMTVKLERNEGQGPPLVLAELEGTVEIVSYRGTPPTVQARGTPAPYRQTLELVLTDGRYLIVGSRGPTPAVLAAPAIELRQRATGLRLENVAAESGLRFRHGAFRFKTSNDPAAAMGGGLCWLDVDGDGWLDLYVVNSYSIEGDLTQWKRRGGTPRSALFRNERGRFVDVSRGSGANVSVRGNGCVAADLNGDGHTDLYVTATGYDALLWNRGDGTFVEGARAAGITSFGWHSGAAVGDVNGDGRPDLYVSSYADLNSPVPAASSGFPGNYRAVRDRLYLNLGPDAQGRSRFRDVAQEAGIETRQVDHGLGVVFTDWNGDGRLDLYVANDTDPNRLLENAPDDAPLGFRLVERGGSGVVADPQAGMGVAAADFNGDARPDLFVTNSHRQLHGVFGSRGRGFADARRTFAPAFDTSYAGWGVTWSDLDLDGDLDVVLANGAIPVRDLARDAEPVQVLEARGREVLDVSEAVLGASGLRVNGRGLAAADYDNDGDVDVAVNSVAGPLALLRNGGAPGHWLEVAVEPFAPGARVTVELADGTRLVREVQAGSSYLSSEDPRVHFGLGRTPTVKALTVRLPDGRTVRRTNVAANQVFTIRS